jgi:hypothetical protein
VTLDTGIGCEVVMVMLEGAEKFGCVGRLQQTPSTWNHHEINFTASQCTQHLRIVMDIILSGDASIYILGKYATQSRL